MNRIFHQCFHLSLWNRIITRVSLSLVMRLWIQTLAAVLMVSAAQAQSPKQLWVFQEPDQMVEYDMTTFTPRRMLTVSRRLLAHPQYLSINSMGQMAFLPPHGMHRASGEMASAGDRLWFWDGHQTREWKLEGMKEPVVGAAKHTDTTTSRQCFLSVSADSLFWFENKFEFKKAQDPLDPKPSVRTTTRIWRTDLAGGRPEPIMSLSSPGWCRCETGACSETCPEWYFWTPDGVVGDFFMVTRFIPGQLGSSYHESLLYQRSGRTWRIKKLPQPIERPLTASEKGEVLVASVPDGGCCAWDNESNDQTLLFQNGKVLLFYDEFDRFNNRNYDVSFFTANAHFAPGNKMLAYTLVSTAWTDSQIRLSSEGKENTEELARLRKAIAELPAVEVVQPGIRTRPLISILHAELVGWLNDREILVVQDRRLAVYDIQGIKRKETTILVRTAADAFLR